MEIKVSRKRNQTKIVKLVSTRIVNCGSSNHLTHMCKIPKNKNRDKFKLGHEILLLEKAYTFFDNFDCMSCMMNVIASCFNMKSKFVEGCVRSEYICRKGVEYKL